MVRKKVKISALKVFLSSILIVLPAASFGQSAVQYGPDIKKETPVRYGPEIERLPRVRYGVDIRAEDIRQVQPGEAPPEEVISDFEFGMRNYLKVSTYYDDLIEYPNINPSNILALDKEALFLEVNTQFELTYLADYQFKADISYQYCPGSDQQSKRDTHFITNEFYFDLYPAELAYLKVGKKRETWGIGWTFSPIDNIIDPPKNLVDPTESREGMYLAGLEIPFGNGSFSFVYFPDVEFDMFTEYGESGIPETMFVDPGTYGLRASYLLWDTDIAATYYHWDRVPDLRKDYFGLSFNRFWLDLGAYLEIEGHKGKDLERVQKTEIGQNYFPLEDELVELKKDEDAIYVNFAVGANYTFPDSSKVALEYFRNNEGYDDDEFDEFVDFIKHEALIHRIIQDDFSKFKVLKANQILGGRIRKNYLSFSFDRPNTFDDFFPHLGAIICLDDGSFMLNGILAYSVRDDTSISLDVKKYVGDDDTEWGLKPDDYRVFLSVKYYF